MFPPEELTVTFDVPLEIDVAARLLVPLDMVTLANVMLFSVVTVLPN
jgi:hypothetical protein